MDSYYKLENLGTMVEPRCGACRCGKCPIPGSRYSHREEGELRLIKDSLRHDGQCWVAEYPYLHPRGLLRGSKEIAFKMLMATERSLKRNKDWGERYNQCILDMIK